MSPPVFEPATVDFRMGRPMGDLIIRVVLVLETHVADRKDDYDVDAILPWCFISRLSC